ncbi:hypothetical protein HD806DRAFT_351858 [Xylariaceae sp. AK1471]|nr:hypothetical protein HD806DRAFT_351858 [Xylariaceae sp. AK1471]
MDNIDPNISNGSCWANVNVALEEDYIPCGNVANGHSYACCHYGDNCLSSNACYHARFGITYLAGCTSQDFSGPACQNKGDFVNQSWVGLTRCDPDQTSWAGCPESKEIVGMNPPTANCKCSKDTILFQDNPTLENIASLPQSLGGTISWFPSHEPTVTTPTNTPSSTSTRVKHSTTVSSAEPTQSGPAESSSSAPTSSSAAQPTSGLSTSDKLGIGLGAGFGPLVIGGLVILAVIIQKRTKNKRTPSPESPPPLTQPSPPPQNYSILASYKAELPADEPQRANANSQVMSSVSNAEPRSENSQVASPVPSAAPSTHSSAPERRSYMPYRPGVYVNTNRFSDFSQLSSPNQYNDGHVSPLSSQTTGMSSQGDSSIVGGPDTIHELEGEGTMFCHRADTNID